MSSRLPNRERKASSRYVYILCSHTMYNISSVLLGMYVNGFVDSLYCSLNRSIRMIPREEVSLDQSAQNYISWPVTFELALYWHRSTSNVAVLSLPSNEIISNYIFASAVNFPFAEMSQ